MPISTLDPLHARLRQATAGAHQDLEDALALLQPQPQAERFRAVLAGFQGFHRIWEPALAARLGDTPFLRERQRLGAIELDLLALQMPPACLQRLPACDLAAALCDEHDATLGSLYVLEGSTLGGKVIARHLADAPWLPAAGLRYFDSPGISAATRWRDTMAYIGRETREPERVIDGATRTFRLLRQWLPAAGSPAQPAARATADA